MSRKKQNGDPWGPAIVTIFVGHLGYLSHISTYGTRFPEAKLSNFNFQVPDCYLGDGYHIYDLSKDPSGPGEVNPPRGGRGL